MKAITDPKLLWFKGGLFLLLGIVSASLLLLEVPRLKVAVLLAVAIWSFCRCYYFVFYVIEHYADPGYRFSGLGSFLRYLVQTRLTGKRR